MAHRLAIAIVALLLAVGVVVATVEAGTHLTGTYAFTSTRTCIVASSPFLDDVSGSPTIIPGPVTRQAAVDSGIATFNHDGTGTSTSRTSSLSLTATGGSVQAISENASSFTYTVNADDTVNVNFGQVTFTIVLGGSTGSTGTVAPRSARLQIVNNGKTLVSAPQNTIEQETVQTNGSSPQFRLCNRSTTYVRQ
jgi:hypothetical protein